MWILNELKNTLVPVGMLKETRINNTIVLVRNNFSPTATLHTLTHTHTVARYDVKIQKAKVTSTMFSLYTIFTVVVAVFFHYCAIFVLYIFYSYPRGGLLCGCYKQKIKKWLLLLAGIYIIYISSDI